MQRALTDLSRRSFVQVALVAGWSRILAGQEKAEDTTTVESNPNGLRKVDVGYVVEGLAFSADSKLLATCGTAEMHSTPQMMRNPKTRPRIPDRPGTIVLWDTETLKPVHVLDGSKDCMSVAFSPDGKMVAGGRKHRGARIWDVTTGAELTTLNERVAERGQIPRGEDYIRSVQFTWDSKELIYGALGRARVWDIASEVLLWKIDDMPWRTRLVALKPKSNELATAGQAEGIILFDIGLGKFIREVEFEIKTELEGRAKWVQKLSYSPNGDYLAFVDSKSAVWLFDTKDYRGQPEWQFEFCRSFAFSPDSTLIALGGPKVQVFELKSRNLVIELPGNMNSQQDLVFSPDGQMLATTAPNLFVNLWDMRAVLPGKKKK